MISSYFFFIYSVFLLYNGCLNQESEDVKCGCKEQDMDHIKNITDLFEANEHLFLSGDMILDYEDILLYKGARTFHNTELKLWPDNTVRYHFDKKYPTRERDLIRTKIERFQASLDNCIRFIESEERPSTRIINGKGCAARVGFVTRSFMILGVDSGCFSRGRGTEHELLHLLGLHHTHSRPDRDKYIKIKWENIESEYCNAFEICKGCNTDYPFDYDSIMIYSSDGFSCKPNVDTMVRIQGGREQIPYNRKMSKTDIKMIKHLYKCA